jgi:hypothetical protein
MNDLERFDKVDRILEDALAAMSSHALLSFDVSERTPEQRAWVLLIDARDEVRTLRARFVSGAGSLTD